IYKELSMSVPLILTILAGAATFIAWYWIVLIVLLAGGYFLHLKRYCKAFRHDRDALLAARSKLDKRSDKEVFEKHQ
ncbi:hypothetical protein, partial [Escherichia coli]|uniref:hypothetical protein n=1 Tax=Escherichia coli TaxID=562 RepID=UPI0010D47C42